MFDYFTERARTVMRESREASRRLGHDYIGCEHILLSLVNLSDSVAAAILKNLELDFDKLIAHIQELITPWEHKRSEDEARPFTPRAKRALETALEEATNFRHEYIGTEHLLLGVLRVEEGIAYNALKAMGINATDVRSEVLELIGAGPDAGSHRLSAVQVDAVELPGTHQFERMLKSLAERMHSLEVQIRLHKEEIADLRKRLRS